MSRKKVKPVTRQCITCKKSFNVPSRSNKVYCSISCSHIKKEDFNFLYYLKQKYKKEYQAWVDMLKRCNDKKCAAYKRYGGRGITVCGRWNIFYKFLYDIGKAPSKEYSLDREENNGNYEPGNVRWATLKQQNENRRINRWIEFRGERMILTDWARRFGLTQSNLTKILAKYSMDQVADGSYKKLRIKRKKSF